MTMEHIAALDDAPWQRQLARIKGGDIRRLDELAIWANALPTGGPDEDSRPDGFETDPYTEIFEWSIARPADIEAVGQFVAQKMRDRIWGKSILGGAIIWRTRVETDIGPHGVITEHGRGPDHDLATNTACTKDRNWIAIKAYCRLRLVKAKADEEYRARMAKLGLSGEFT